jgi:hypothetical protein
MVVWFGAPAASARDTHVSIDVIDVSPNTPAVTRAAKPLTFTLAVTNYTSIPMHVTISAVRSDPIGTQSQLDNAITEPHEPSPSLVSPIQGNPTARVRANHTITIPFETSTSNVFQIAQNRGGICLCANAIYPIWFSADYANSEATGTATTQTYLPSFTEQPTKSTVSWVWPLLDRPHRLLHHRVFTDDQLAEEVAPTGRLGRMLDVVQQVSPDVPMTLVTDPDLIDELVQMAHGYSVITPGGLHKGTGTAAAAQWLATLQQVLSTNHQVQLVFTPFADPAVDSLHNAGRGWGVELTSGEQQAVINALGRTPLTDLAWPAAEALSHGTLNTLVKQGVNTVLTADRVLTAGTGDGTEIPDALATVNAGPGRAATLAVTSTSLQRLVEHVLDPSGNGLVTLPQLVAQLAMRVVLEPNVSHYIVMTPPRDLDVNVDVAVRTIEATANSPWSRPLTIESAVGRIKPVDHGQLRDNAHGPALSHRLLRTLDHVNAMLPELKNLYDDPDVGAAFVAPFPAAVQRCQSSSLLGDRARALEMARRLARIVDRTRSAVRIQKPFSNGTYTLTSENSKLPITVVNTLPFVVDVKISVRTKDDVPGLTAGDEDKVFIIKANSKVQEHIPTRVDHVGKIIVFVTIHTRTGTLLGKPIRLALRSTALGTIGVIITVVAAIVLALAVVVRTVRRLRQRKPEEEAPAEPSRAPAPAAP